MKQYLLDVNEKTNQTNVSISGYSIIFYWKTWKYYKKDQTTKTCLDVLMKFVIYFFKN